MEPLRRCIWELTSFSSSKNCIRIVVEFIPMRIILQGWVVGISIRAVTATIDVTVDVGHDTYGIACIDVT